MADPLGDDAARLRALGVDPEPVSRAALALAGVLGSGGKLLTLGNGGSAADAQHFAAELVGRFELERPALPAIALTTDTSILTAVGNDYGFDRVFARQVEAHGRSGDAVLAISTSGTSANVLAAVEAARAAGMTTIGLCGAPGCRLCESVDIAIAADLDGTASVQEAHLAIEHALCRSLEDLLFADGDRQDRPRPGDVVSLDDLMQLRERWRAAGRVVVWTNGCFDVLHAGHLSSLEAASRLGDVLVVGVNSDESTRRLKGEGRPLMPGSERAEILAALRIVDHVIVFDEDTPERMLASLQPDVHCKGADYRPPDGKPIPEASTVEAYGGRIEFLPMLPDRSTTAFLETIGRRSS